MKCLLTAATLEEIKPTIRHFGFPETAFSSNAAGNLQLDVLISGVGMVSTTHQLTRALLKTPYDLAVNAGIAGAFDRNLALGDVVQVSSDQFPEMGAEDGQQFLSLIQLGLQDPKAFPFLWGELCPQDPWLPELRSLQKVRGITVNKVHGHIDSILAMQDRVNPQVESMEGAAFYYVCMSEQVPCVQIRSISNYVEPRNRDAWNIPLAVKELNQYLIEMITVLVES